jgi:hypothetical protein
MEMVEEVKKSILPAARQGDEAITILPSSESDIVQAVNK